MSRFLTLVFVMLLFVSADVLRAQHAPREEPMTFEPGSAEFHLGAGLPSGLNVGARYRLFHSVSVEASLGTYFTTLVYSAGFNVHRELEHEAAHPTISILASYFRKNGDWYSASAMIGLLNLEKYYMHSSIRGGISFLASRPSGSSGASHRLRIVPLPALELGIGYTIH